MGSSGTGNFSDYSGSAPSSKGEKTGGASGEDKCLLAFSTILEDVARCQFFITHGTVPAEGEEIQVVFNTRIVAVSKIGEEIGYLPTKYNYLKVCMDNGTRYSGHVSSSSIDPIPSVRIDVIPI
ncbi:MAG: hypothetical protein Q8M08_10425 [Bacteroidales bacterium]|nr:hypothetical protein [Bacteroidales bacterium]